MPITRRQLLAQTAAGLALPTLARADMMIGAGQITTLSDGFLTLPGDFILSTMPQAEAKSILETYDLGTKQLTPDCNVTLYRDGDRVVLFDVGSGAGFMDSAGLLIDSLDAADIAPEDVTDVVFTHAHPDHIWGLLDDFDDPAFPEARYHMGRVEWDYWWNPNTVHEIGEARASFASGAKRRMEVIADQVTLFDDGQEVMPGIGAVASYGHTPGHMSFEIRQGGTAAIIAGDAIGNHHVAFHRPGWESGSDQDPAMAVSARQRLLDRLAGEGMTLVGFHLPGGGIGHVERASDGYRFLQS